MSSQLEVRSKKNKTANRARELLRNTDILVIICEFLDDKDFIAFLMVPRINLISDLRCAKQLMNS